METVQSKFSKREREIIALLKQGYNYKRTAQIYNIDLSMLCEVVQDLFKKVNVKSRVAFLKKIERMEDEMPVFQIAKDEWENLYPDTDLITMNERERDFAWQHWLKAWKLSSQRFR